MDFKAVANFGLRDLFEKMAAGFKYPTYLSTIGDINVYQKLRGF